MNVYDFDKTIYNGDSTVDFYLYCLRKKPSVLRFAPRQAAGFLAYCFGKRDKTRLKETFFCFLRAIECERYVRDFWAVHTKKLFSWYLDRQCADDVVISASPDFLLRPVCEQLGIKHLIASEVSPETGRFAGRNCRGEEKVRRFREQFAAAGIESFYSDSLSDSPMAQLADRAFLVVKGRVTDWNKDDA